MTKNKNRKISNFILLPFIQIRIGLYSAVLATIFFSLLGFFVYHQMSEFIADIVELTEIEMEVGEIVNNYLLELIITAIGVGASFLAANVCLSIYYTHKIIGPGVAIKRHIDALIEGDYNHQVHLRDGDAFQDIAKKLNHLSETLKQSK